MKPVALSVGVLAGTVNVECVGGQIMVTPSLTGSKTATPLATFIVYS